MLDLLEGYHSDHATSLNSEHNDTPVTYCDRKHVSNVPFNVKLNHRHSVCPPSRNPLFLFHINTACNIKIYLICLLFVHCILAILYHVYRIMVLKNSHTHCVSRNLSFRCIKQIVNLTFRLTA